ncbi:hypothetical protein P8452_46465 [Trifolium repens]|nr:hypothetical protein P8452_46465 [Trifolium repens]
MPSSSGRQRLEKLLGVDDEEADFSVMDPMNKNSPVSFVSSGTIYPETVQVIAVDSVEPDSANKKGATSSANADIVSLDHL